MSIVVGEEAAETVRDVRKTHELLAATGSFAFGNALLAICAALCGIIAWELDSGAGLPPAITGNPFGSRYVDLGSPEGDATLQHMCASPLRRMWPLLEELRVPGEEEFRLMVAYLPVRTIEETVETASGLDVEILRQHVSAARWRRLAARPVAVVGYRGVNESRSSWLLGEEGGLWNGSEVGFVKGGPEGSFGRHLLSGEVRKWEVLWRGTLDGAGKDIAGQGSAHSWLELAGNPLCGVLVVEKRLVDAVFEGWRVNGTTGGKSVWIAAAALCGVAERAARWHAWGVAWWRVVVKENVGFGFRVAGAVIGCVLGVTCVFASVARARAAQVELFRQSVVPLWRIVVGDGRMWLEVLAAVILQPWPGLAQTVVGNTLGSDVSVSVAANIVYEAGRDVLEERGDLHGMASQLTGTARVGLFLELWLVALCLFRAIVFLVPWALSASPVFSVRGRMTGALAGLPSAPSSAFATRWAGYVVPAAVAGSVILTATAFLTAALVWEGRVSCSSGSAPRSTRSPIPYAAHTLNISSSSSSYQLQDVFPPNPAAVAAAAIGLCEPAPLSSAVDVAVATWTTIGYGDIVPLALLSRISAVASALAALVAISFAVSSLLTAVTPAPTEALAQLLLRRVTEGGKARALAAACIQTAWRHARAKRQGAVWARTSGQVGPAVRVVSAAQATHRAAIRAARTWGAFRKGRATQRMDAGAPARTRLVAAWTQLRIKEVTQTVNEIQEMYH